MEQQEEEDRKRETERLRADVEQQLLALKEMFAQSRKTDAQDSAAACASSNDAQSEVPVAESEESVVKAHSGVDANCESTSQQPALDGIVTATQGFGSATEGCATASVPGTAVENNTQHLTALTA
jgi:hypothetical protein